MKAKNIASLRLAAGLPLLVCLAAGPAAAQARLDTDENPVTAPAEAPAAEAAPAPVEAPSAEAAPPEQTDDMGDELFDEDESVRDATKGLVKGVVKSKADGQPLIEARVSVEGTSISTLTDIDGNFELELPPGNYEFRVWYELHQPQRVQNVAVEAGGEQALDVALVADGDAIQEVVVEVEADRSKAAVQMEKRKRAAVVMDAVSGEEMSKTPDSSAADAMKRVVGATVVDGKYLVVRGLGGRYTTTLLEGVPVPSPEPDLPSVPLDLFPSSLLSSVTVAKTASPDLPGNFAGGALLIDAKQFPSDFALKLNAGMSGDSVSTFQDAPRYAGSSTDAFGFDDGLRDLPSAVPTDGAAGRAQMSRAEREAIGESFDRTWDASSDSLPANFSLGASVGDSFSALGNRMGYLASVGWGQNWDFEETTSGRMEGGDLADRNLESASIRKVKLGGLGSLAYQLTPTDDLSFLTLYSRSADDRAQKVRGADANDGDYEKTQLAYVSRQLSFNQLAGHHRLERVGGLEVDWQSNYSIVDRDEPNTRSLTYERNADGTTSMIRNRGADVLNAVLEDHTYGGGVDVGLPLEGVKPKVGVFYSKSERDYQTRRFSFSANRASNETLALGPDSIFTDETIGRDFEFSETTKEADSYVAQMETLATYAMLDVALFDPFRAIFGARYEKGSTNLDVGSKYKTTDDPIQNHMHKVEEDILPSVNLVYALAPNMNLRTAYGMTVSRPVFREISPATQYDFVKRRYFTGNPDLERTLIHNADLRFEVFPGATEVLAASVFGKVFESPIEQVVQSDGGGVAPRNAKGGHVYGLELESRVGLYHLTPALAEFGFTANLTLAASEVELDEENLRTTTNAKRPLQGQSPYSFNFGLLYENALSSTTAQLLYNVFGPRLDAVGYQGIDDTYEESFHRLDLVVTQNVGQGLDMKVGATNLLDQDEVFAVGDTEVSRFSPGVGASASLGWTF